MKRGEWLLPLPYTAEALMSCFLDVHVEEIEMITEANVQFTITIDRS
jgi:hypothetical protein